MNFDMISLLCFNLYIILPNIIMVIMMMMMIIVMVD